MHGDHVLGFVTPPAAEVDCEDDFDFLEFEASRKPAIFETLFGRENVKLSHQ